MKNRLRIFLDTSALFSAIYSSSGGARLVLKMGEAAVISIWVGNKVLSEVDAVLMRKFPEGRPLFAFLLDQASVQTAPRPIAKHFREASEITDYEPDMQVVAEALAADTDYLITFDRKHLIDSPKAHLLPFPVGTASDFLNWYREKTRKGES